MRVINIALTAYFVLVSVQAVTASKQSRRTKCNKNNKKNLSWRLKLLRKISLQLKPDINLLSLRPKEQRDYLPRGQPALIHKEESHNRHIPKIICNDESPHLLPCPTPDRNKNFYCISETSLCDGFYNCPNGEDEDLVGCMFHTWADVRFGELYKAIKQIKGGKR